MDALRNLWTGAGLQEVQTREITVQRTFADFEELWTISCLAPGLRSTMAGMSAGDVERLKAGVCARLAADGTGRITCSARANAAQGRVPA
jgi:hypothetical protein